MNATSGGIRLPFIQMRADFLLTHLIVISIPDHDIRYALRKGFPFAT